MKTRLVRSPRLRIIAGTASNPARDSAGGSTISSVSRIGGFSATSEPSPFVHLHLAHKADHLLKQQSAGRLHREKQTTKTLSAARGKRRAVTSKARARRCAHGLCAQMIVLAAAVMMGCAPSASQIAETRTDQSWAAEFRKDRQECIDNVPHACSRFENELTAQQAYNLYYNSKTIPGLATPTFTPVTVPVAIGLPRFSGGMSGFR
jgi:hypothetical protein